MAYIDPKTGDVLGEDSPEVESAILNSIIKGAQSQLICIPFGIPYACPEGYTCPGIPLGSQAWMPGVLDSSDFAENWALQLLDTVVSNMTPYNYDFSIGGNGNSAGWNAHPGSFAPLAQDVHDLDKLRGLVFSRIKDTRYDTNSSNAPKIFIEERSADYLNYSYSPYALTMQNEGGMGISQENLKFLSGWIPDPQEAAIGQDKGHDTLGLLLLKMALTVPANSYLDATFRIQKSFAETAYTEAAGEALGISDPVKVKAHYNFYIQPYEKIIKDLHKLPLGSTDILMTEVIIPNLYALMIDMPKLGNPGLTSEFDLEHGDQWQYHGDDEVIYTNAAFSSGYAHAAATITPGIVYTPKAKSGPVETFNEYLNKFAEALKKTAESHTGDVPYSLSLTLPEKRKYDTIGVSAYKIQDYMDEADKIKKFFPMHVDIEIPAENGGKIGKILYEASLFDEFMQLIIAAMFPRGTNNNVDFHWPTTIIKKDSSIYDDPLTQGVDLAKEKDTLYREPLINLWLNDILNDASMPDLDNFKTNTLGTLIDDGPTLNFLKKINPSLSAPFIRPIIFGKKKTSSMPFITNLKWAAAKKKILNFISQKTRAVSDIYDGKLAYSEILFYEVVKFRRTGTPTDFGGTFVQNIFLPNTPNMAVLKYIDTQVKYDSDYYYQVYAHTVVIGTQYDFANISKSEDVLTLDDNTEATETHISYLYTPSVFLMRVPYYNTYVTMSDVLTAEETGQDFTVDTMDIDKNAAKLEETPIVSHPPVFPDAVFIPLSGEKNKILLNAALNIGEYDLVPESIEDNGDWASDLERIKKNQKKIGTKTKITYKEDDYCGQIEILRIENRPLAWADFAPISNYLIGYAGGSSNFGQIIEQQPNKDYYYTVRAIDVHGYYSNPSPIYQVRIVNKVGEAPYTIVNMFFIDEEPEKKTVGKKDLMKYIRIQPAFKQSYLDDKSITEDYNSVEDFTAAISNGTAVLYNFIGDQTLEEDKEVFGHEFKFRFTSKKTGRKFDLNLSIDEPYTTAGTGESTLGVTDSYSSGKC